MSKIHANFVGNLGKDCEVKTFGDKQYTCFSVAVSEKDSTQWVSCYKYGVSENLNKYLKSGTKVFICGELTIKQSESGGKIYTNVNANVTSLELIGSKLEQETQTQAQPYTQPTNSQPFAPEAAPADSLPF